ncbi:MAG: DUF418 domain-containing protein [Phycisphaerales bacterium]
MTEATSRGLAADGAGVDGGVVAAPGSFGPVQAGERVNAVDLLRGFALCGILLMNIVSFALPSSAYVNPAAESLVPYAGEFTGLNFAVWLAQYLLCDGKMMSIFSMLFGAGLVLMDGRAAARHGVERKGRFAGVYYRRIGTLLVIGMAHAYLVWYGDVLVTYALCGLVLYPVRGWQPRTLMVVGALLIGLGMLIGTVVGGSLALMDWKVRDVTGRLAEGESPPEHVTEMRKGVEQFRGDMVPTPEKVAWEVAAHRGSPGEIISHNAKQAMAFQLFLLPMFFVWRVAGLMMIGMGLMKAGVFSASRSTGFYVGMSAVGYGLGLSLLATAAMLSVRNGFEPIAEFLYVWRFNEVGSLAVALGHVGVVMLVHRAGGLAWLRSRLSAAGRMGLTNYLAQSLICVFIFWGWGFGLFGKIERGWLPLFVVGVWALELAWSPWWLARFRFGPAEWVWRSCSHLRAQPMRIGSNGA